MKLFLAALLVVGISTAVEAQGYYYNQPGYYTYGPGGPAPGIQRGRQGETHRGFGPGYYQYRSYSPYYVPHNYGGGGGYYGDMPSGYYGPYGNNCYRGYNC